MFRYKTLGAARVWLSLVAALLAAGCAEAPPKFTPVQPIPAGQGVIYLYRPAEAGGEGMLGTVLVRQKSIVQITNGGYYPYVARPGPVYFQLITSDPSRTLISKALMRIEAGREKYLKISRIGDRLKFTPVFPQIAKSEIAAAVLMQPAPADSLAMTAARPTYAHTPARPRPTPTISKVQGKFSFEAERLAIENGCTTPDGIRPAAYLVEQAEPLEIYDVACGATRMSVGCEYQYCELLQR